MKPTKQDLHFIEFEGTFYIDSPTYGLIDTYPEAMLKELAKEGGASLDIDYGPRIWIDAKGVEIGPEPMTRPRFRLTLSETTNPNTTE